ncbi:hypothetical protein ZHAS_00022034 [Anopheles sinensis]|uniref:Uncharacterized protein n=1 Tax=Anopheles sinensis TaxID=74873 RepID=A0A084WUA3_ANOSI|nr:hypothetical protein ZHAS_00022034 [Anopheles sinensis]
MARNDGVASGASQRGEKPTRNDTLWMRNAPDGDGLAWRQLAIGYLPCCTEAELFLGPFLRQLAQEVIRIGGKGNDSQ